MKYERRAIDCSLVEVLQVRVARIVAAAMYFMFLDLANSPPFGTDVVLRQNQRALAVWEFDPA